MRRRRGSDEVDGTGLPFIPMVDDSVFGIRCVLLLRNSSMRNNLLRKGRAARGGYAW